MTVEFRLPDVGEGLEEAEIVQWLVAPGERIERDQPVVEILTDKAQVELPAPSPGTVTRLGAPVGEIMRVGEVLIVIDDGKTSPRASDPTPGAAANEAPGSAAKSTGASAVAPPPGTLSASRPTLRPKASPSTRRKAARLGIDLATVEGRGPGGRILAEDLDRPAPAAVPATAAAGVGPVGPVPTGAMPAGGAAGSLGQAAFGVQPLRGIRRATAVAMDTSWSTIPHVTGMNEIDATELMAARARLRDTAGDRGRSITPLALMMVAVARALRRYPLVNATLDLAAGTITVHERVNIGVAVATEHGLIVPVVTDADRRGILDMAAEIGRLSTAARDRKITAQELAGGTFTVTNYGTQGGHFAAPIIRPGESGIMGFGAIAKRPFVVGDEVLARDVLPIVMSGDHRLIDGDLLQAFQLDVASNLTDPVRMLL